METVALTKAVLLVLLTDEAPTYDQEMAHIVADQALLAFINDPEISEAYEAINKWYA